MHYKRIILNLIIIFMCYDASASVSNGFYVGLEAGMSNQEVNYSSSYFNINTNGSVLSSSGQAVIGRLNLGYAASKYNSFELGINSNFMASQSYPANSNGVSMSTSNLDASYLLSLPLAIDRFAVFGRLGISYDWINSGGLCGCGNGNSLSGNNFADILGAGVKYNVSPSLSWRLEWISNALLFPVGLTSNTGQNIGSWNAQQFQMGVNYYF